MALLQVSTGGRTNSNKHSLQTRQVAVAKEVVSSVNDESSAGQSQDTVSTTLCLAQCLLIF